MPTGIPVAVAPSVRSPGLALSVNLKAGLNGAGAGMRGLIMATKGSLGSITPDTQLVRGIGSSDDAATLLGAGVPGHLAIKRVFEEYALAQLDLVSPAEPGGGTAATATLLFDDSSGSSTDITKPQTVTVKIKGVEVTFIWAVGETRVQAATKCVAAISAKDDDLPVVATNSGGASQTVTLTFKVKGKIGNDCLVSASMADGAGGAVTASAAALSGGVGEPDFAAALSTVRAQEYDFILPCVSNYDATTASTTTGVGKLKAQIESVNTGFAAKLQQGVVGVTGTLSAVKTGANQHNAPELEYVFCQAGQSLPCEWGAAEMGARMREEAIDPAVNRIDTAYRATLYGAEDLVADALTEPEVEDALQNGVTPVTYESTGVERVSRPVTTYHKDANGNPDDRVTDVSRVSGTFAVAKDLRTTLPQEFKGAKLSPDLPPGDDEVPPGVVEVREIKAFVIQRCFVWVSKGVVRKDKLIAAIDDGSLIVRVNPSDASQCDIVIPTSIVPPLAKMSVVVQQKAN